MQMTTEKFRFLLLVIPLSFALASAGCSYRAWYEGFQSSARQDCYKHKSDDEIQTCLDQVNAMDYDDYQRSREK